MDLPKTIRSTADERFVLEAHRRTRRSRSPLSPLLAAACRVGRLRLPAMRAVRWLEGGELWSSTFRELMQTWYGVTIGMHSYGPCLEPGVLPPGTQVGNYCSFGPDIQVFRRNHPTDRLSQHPFFFNSELGLLERDSIGGVVDNPLIIGHDVWVGCGVVVTARCTRIGDGAIVAAQSVLTADVPPLAIVGGAPAKLLRWRFSETTRESWLRNEWWKHRADHLPIPLDAFMRPYKD